MTLRGYDTDGAVVAELVEENRKLKNKNASLEERIKTLEKLIKVLKKKGKKETVK